ncbi:MAG: RNA 2',3'-cyclic phosphodiesterase [Candidatus Micrarchaeia archaeon]|jgi:2'-5' RNA ligase
MRIFAAIPVPGTMHPALSRAAEHLRDCMGVRLLPPSDWHLTLRFIGDADEEKAKQIGDALAAVKFSPFTVHLSRAGAYPSTHFPRAIYIGGESEGAVKLAADVEAALAPFGLQREKFSVHVTVARSKGAGDIDAFLKNAGEVCTFEVNSFVLMRSRLLPQGASYEVLKEFPAQAP